MNLALRLHGAIRVKLGLRARARTVDRDALGYVLACGQALYPHARARCADMTGPTVLDSDFRYVDARGNLLRTRVELSVARLLAFLGHDYEYDARVSVGKKTIRVDFATDRGLIEVIDSEEDLAKYAMLKDDASLDVIGIGHARYAARTNEFDDIVVYGSHGSGETGSIFIEDESFTFDYAHILPLVEKCSILHGHTSSVMVELAGQTHDGLLIDFGEAKRIIRGVIAVFDHKFFINRKYVTQEDDSHYRVGFDGPKGEFDLRVPKDTTYTLEGEATVENLSGEIIRRLADKLPKNVEAVGVYIYEGYNKGAHMISSLRR